VSKCQSTAWEYKDAIKKYNQLFYIWEEKVEKVFSQDKERARETYIQDMYLLFIYKVDISITRVVGRTLYYDNLFFLPINLRVIYL